MPTFMNRTLLDNALNKLRTDIVALSSMVDKALDDAMQALAQRDVALAHQVVANDHDINRLRFVIEDDSVRCLATQQPAAIDLRTILAGVHLAGELERMGDHAAGIAKLVERLDEEEEIDSLHKLPKMAKRARQMIADAIQAFLDGDAEAAQKIFAQDDKLDRQYRKLFQNTLEEMRDDSYIRRATFLLWVGHNLERVGDRATNIAERVIFMVTGRLVEAEMNFDDIMDDVDGGDDTDE